MLTLIAICTIFSDYDHEVESITVWEVQYIKMMDDYPVMKVLWYEAMPWYYRNWYYFWPIENCNIVWIKK